MKTKKFIFLLLSSFLILGCNNTPPNSENGNENNQNDDINQNTNNNDNNGNNNNDDDDLDTIDDNGNNNENNDNNDSDDNKNPDDNIIDNNDDNDDNDNLDDNQSHNNNDNNNQQNKYDIDPSQESKYSYQSYLNYLGDIQDVWQDYRGDNVTIAIIDSGFYVNHSEFYFADGTSKISNDSASFTKNGIAQVGRDKVGITDGDSHGTICATVAAASVTGNGTVGVAPNAKLMLLKVDKTTSAINKAFQYAADKGVKIISISLGAYNNKSSYDIADTNNLNEAFEQSTKYAHDKGVVICSAAGNGGYNNPTEYTYPGAASYVIGAGGLADKSRTRIWSGSSYNSSKKYQFVDVFAPAENLYSGCYFDRDNVHYDYDGGFEGTSFASPIIAGAAALYFEKYPNHTNIDFERALFNTCDTFGDSNQTGYGAINIKKLMNYEKPADAEKDFYVYAPNWWSQDNASTYAYSWNYANTIENNNYPGLMMTNLKNGYFKINIDTSLYSWLLFSRYSADGRSYWGAKTIDLEISQFKNNNCFVISDSAAWESDSKYATGTFSQYHE